MRLYSDLATWWPLISPPSDYVEEAVDLLQRLPPPPPGDTLLELGSGGGSLAFHLKCHYRATLTDLSPGMLDVSRSINPECEHILGDMRSLRLGRQFDVVLIHDAIMYATTPADVAACLATAAAHCREGGTVVVIPDCVRETFEPDTDHGGYDAADGRGVRFMDWTWDPDPADDTYVVDYAFLLRHADGSCTVEHDRHVEGMFSRDQWLRWFDDAGLSARAETDPWKRVLFVARKCAR